MQYQVFRNYEGNKGFCVVEEGGKMLSCHQTQKDAEDQVICLLESKKYIEEEVDSIMQKAMKRIQKYIDFVKTQGAFEDE